MTTKETQFVQRKRQRAISLNLKLLWLTRHWLRVALVVVGLYATLPIAAPLMMRMGLTGPGRALYLLYSPFCHQFGFRSFFLFGEQPVYPRAAAGTDYTPWEVYASESSEFNRIFEEWRLRFPGSPPGVSAFSPAMQFAAKEFIGDERMGYKMTLCERDVSIYLALFSGGLIYTLVRRRLRPAPLWLYVILGLAPIGIDGFSQLFGYPPFNLWPPRETLPVFRVVTGALFGLMNAWLAFPHMEIAMRDTRLALEDKLLAAGVDISGVR